jgi:hypothetical protein
MSNLQEAFNIPINPENKEFVRNPYIPVSSGSFPYTSITVSPLPLTVGRCFDIKYGAKNCFMPSYTQYQCNNNCPTRADYQDI